MVILIIIGAIFIAYLILKPYVISHDTIVLYTGGNGSGKTFFSVKDALKCLKRLRLKTKLHNFLEHLKFWKSKKNKKFWEKPLLFSTMPIKISRKEWCLALKNEHLLLQEKLPLRSVVFIDEVNLLLSQMDYKFKSERVLNEFVTMFRHYVQGYLILNTQNLSKVHWIFRYCCNEAINLSEFKKPILGLPILAWAKVRKITLGDDIKAVETDDAHKQKSNLFAFFGLRAYDTYCYSDRYITVPVQMYDEFICYKVLKFNPIDCKKEYQAQTYNE